MTMVLDGITFGGSYRIAQLLYRRDDGTTHRECRSPGADLSDLPKAAQERIAAEWTDDVIARWRDDEEKRQRAAPEPEPRPDPIRAKLAEMEQRLAALETTRITTRT